MKRINLLVLAGTLLVTASGPAVHARVNGRADEVLANMQKAASSIKSIQAKLEQRKRLAIGGTEIYRGEIFFKHVGKNSDRVRINYEIPAGQTVAVNDKEIILYQKEINQCHITSRKTVGTSSNQEFAFFATPYSLTSAQLKARYEITYVGPEHVDGASTEVLELTPKTKSNVRKMRWWVDQNSWLPIRSQVVEQTNDVTTFILRDARINGPMTSGQLDFPCPSDSKRIRH